MIVERALQNKMLDHLKRPNFKPAQVSSETRKHFILFFLKF